MTLTMAILIGVVIALLIGIPRWVRYRQDQELMRMVEKAKARVKETVG